MPDETASPIGARPGLRGRLRRLLPYGAAAAAPASMAPVLAETWHGQTIQAPLDIVDPAALERRLNGAADKGDAQGQRAEILAALRETLAAGRAVIRRRFVEEVGTADACVAESAYLMDVLIGGLASLTVSRLFPVSNPTVGERFAVAAVGGYGRGELAPFSDIDLLFLLPYKRNPRVEQVVEYMLYLLWDLGLKVGHSVRSVDDSLRLARSDTTICTSLMETRLLWGEPSLYDTLRRRFVEEVAAGTGAAFTEAKLAERDARHRRMGDSRYVLEPNVKEGKGGLRDLQTLFWIGKYLYQVDDVDGLVAKGVLTTEEARRFRRSESFLLAVRCHLHYLTGRAEDRLTFDLQPELARVAGYTDHAGAKGVERLMKHYFLVAKEVGNLTRIFCAALEAESQRRPKRGLAFLGFAAPLVDGLPLDGDRVSLAGEKQIREHPVDIIRLFRVAQARDLDIHPAALKLITRNIDLIAGLRDDPEANRIFLEILTAEQDPEIPLRRMNEAGVLGRFVPDFGRVVAQMQYDMYHTYTVDEHTLFALGILHKIETGEAAETLPLATQVMRKTGSRRALYVALLCHDIAKGRGGDHSILGARVVRKLGPRFGLTPEETETAQWLVRWHLLLSDTAFKRDIEDEKTVQDFAAAVESPERLRLLLMLTAADISAVGPGRWTAWKATLMAELYHRADERLSGADEAVGVEHRVDQAKDLLRQALADWPPAAVEAYLGKASRAYWLAFDGATQARHARLVRAAEAEGEPLAIDIQVDQKRTVAELTIHTADHPGLFSRLAGAIAVSGGTIVEAKIFTFADGMALDTFLVQDAVEGGAFDAPEKLARVKVSIERSLSGEMKMSAELERRHRSYPRLHSVSIAPRVLVDNEASRTHTVIELNGRDRPGLLHAMGRALTGLGLQISSAKISTFGARAVDVFYVKDVFGLKVTHEAKLAQIRSTLAEVLADPVAKPLAAPKRRPRARRSAA
ncbi:[protein-PII] uridylyltransferase [Inquilinus limosus]|nr:[protein-PII] uridylyltransferase [Inquilinus limosus]